MLTGCGSCVVYRWTQAAAQEPVRREPRTWRRVTRAAPCPICGKPDWCSVSEDTTAALCMRMSEGAVRAVDMPHGIGHVHELGAGVRPASPVPMVSSIPQMALDCGAILARWRQDTEVSLLQACAASLSVQVNSLIRLDCTWSRHYGAWAFPMHDDRRRVIGIRLRTQDGRKWSVRGSHSGCFIPSGLDSRSTLLICEGATDTAAALSLGYAAIGRPSCSGGAEILVDLLKAGRRRAVVIVSDHDPPGKAGARDLAERIVAHCGSLRVIDTAPHKDLRQWLHAEPDMRAALERRIAGESP
jgi:hypothetical protein